MMQLGSLRGAEKALGWWVAENALAAVLAYTAWQVTAFPTVLFGLIIVFVAVQVLAPIVWIGFRLPFIHSIQALLRLAFYLGTVVMIVAFAPLTWKAIALVGIPAVVVAYMTDFVWYETTIAP